MKRVITLLLIATVSMMAKINGAGASFPAPAYYAWMDGYKNATEERINYLPTGSGGGIKSIKHRIVNFGASDKPLKPKDLKKNKLLMFPTLVGTIVLAHNISGIEDHKLKLSDAVLEGIFMGSITNWNDPKIAADNKGVTLPDAKITVVHRSDGSGTTFNFTYYMSIISAEWKTKVGAGKAVSWPTGIGGKGNEGVTNMIKKTPNSIGYIELAYAKKNNLPRAQVKNKDGFWVKATEENSADAAKYAKWTKEEHFYQVLAYQPGKTSYPIVAGTFLLVPEKGSRNSKKSAEVLKFIDWAYTNGDKLAADLGYIPLPQETKDMIRSYWKDNGLF